MVLFPTDYSRPILPAVDSLEAGGDSTNLFNPFMRVTDKMKSH